MKNERQNSMIRAEKTRIEALLRPAVLKRIATVSESSKRSLPGAKRATEIRRSLSARVRSQFPSASAQDIEALAYLVMFELWEQEESDLREMIEEMRRMNEAKKAQKEYLDIPKKQKQKAQRQIREEFEELKGQSQGAAAKAIVSGHPIIPAPEFR
jgi:predicted nucleotide-binding protein (sugar kinase/HSP70/actin superfamily)